MEVNEVIRKKEKLKEDIIKLMKNFCEETKLQIGHKTEIVSFYDQERVKGDYNVDLNLRNPF